MTWGKLVVNFYILSLCEFCSFVHVFLCYLSFLRCSSCLHFPVSLLGSYTSMPVGLGGRLTFFLRPSRTQDWHNCMKIWARILSMTLAFAHLNFSNNERYIETSNNVHFMQLHADRYLKCAHRLFAWDLNGVLHFAGRMMDACSGTLAFLRLCPRSWMVQVCLFKTATTFLEIVPFLSLRRCWHLTLSRGPEPWQLRKNCSIDTYHPNVKLVSHSNRPGHLVLQWSPVAKAP